MNHNRIYLGLLGLLAFAAAASTCVLLFLAGAVSAGSVINSRIPDWSLEWVAAINFAYLLAILFVFSARWLKPDSGKKLTRILNWTLLPALPGGTIVGLYGLLAADRPRN